MRHIGRRFAEKCQEASWLCRKYLPPYQAEMVAPKVYALGNWVYAWVVEPIEFYSNLRRRK